MAQGNCGACWAFTGNTLLEATEYIYQQVPDNLKSKKELSFQYPVDCVSWEYPYYLAGCSGGDALRMFDFYKNEGTVNRHDYEYESGLTGATG